MDGAQAEANLVIVREALLDVGRALWLGIPARIGKIPFAYGAVLPIRPVHPGDHYIDGITIGRFNLRQIGHLNPLERLRDHVTD